jgi:hypothetical protein
MLLRFYNQDGQPVGEAIDMEYWASPLQVGDECPLEGGTYIVETILGPQVDWQENVLVFALIVKPK